MLQEVTTFRDKHEKKHRQIDSAASVNKKRAKPTTEDVRLLTRTEGNNDAKVDANRLIQAILSMHDVPITPVYDTRDEVRRKASQWHLVRPHSCAILTFFLSYVTAW